MPKQMIVSQESKAMTLLQLHSHNSPSSLMPEEKKTTTKTPPPPPTHNPQHAGASTTSFSYRSRDNWSRKDIDSTVPEAPKLQGWSLNCNASLSQHRYNPAPRQLKATP